MNTKPGPPLIGIVGVCASGKSTLIRLLTERGYNCRHIAQEHSYVANMWKRITNPDILIFLEVSYETTLKRKNLNWTREEYNIQVQRVKNAHEHADIRIDTNSLTPSELLNIASLEIETIISSNS